MRLVRESEFIAVDERGARLGNFGTARIDETRSAVMVAECMQPCVCEAHGSDNTIFFSILEGK